MCIFRSYRETVTIRSVQSPLGTIRYTCTKSGTNADTDAVADADRHAQTDAIRLAPDAFVNLLSWANTTSHDALVWARTWQRFISDPKVFIVDADFFGSVAQMPAYAQFIRLAFIAWQYGGVQPMVLHK